MNAWEREKIRDRILARGDRAAEYAKLAREIANPTSALIEDCVYNYVCYKFLLKPEDSRGLTMSELADKSLERALELKLPLAKESEKATTCGMAGSTAMKIALLLNALRKDFRVEAIPPRTLGYVKDVKELSDLVYRAIQGAWDA